jgi:hypothetical protein
MNEATLQEPFPRPFIVDVGCGDRKVELPYVSQTGAASGADAPAQVGYVYGVDFRALPDVDLVCDIRRLAPEDLPQLADGIVARHVVEHFEFRESSRLVARLVGCLVPRGVVHIEVPRMDFIARHWFDRPGNLEWQRWLIDMAYGAQDYPGNYHMTLFSPELLRDVMERAGLVDIEIRDAVQVAVGVGRKPEGWEMPSDERLSYPFQHFPVTFR